MTRPTLWVAATPIGNLGDASGRLVEALNRAGLILAEDTRRAGLLCRALDVEPAGFLSLHEHNEESRIGRVLKILDQGKDLVLISDAGTPLVSDPGYRLVAACIKAGHRVSPIPGPSAVASALSCSGLPPHPHVFLGFMPRKAGQAERLLARFGPVNATLVFFERKDRLAATLKTAAKVLGDRPACIAREMTKEYEEFFHGTLGSLAGEAVDLLGEVTVVVGPGEEGRDGEERVMEVVREESAKGGKPRQVAARAAERLRGWTAKMVYEKVVDR